jgi:hypothetical protein
LTGMTMEITRRNLAAEALLRSAVG